MLVYPEYMDRFRCLASECRDNCCIGWEIEIDRETLGKYKTLTLDDGKPILEQTEGEDVRHFKLRADGRCPFLDCHSLCRIISLHGGESVPEICREHPRYYSAFPDITEAGLGLCCEEACRIILSGSLPVRFRTKSTPSDEGAEGVDETLELCRKYRNDLFGLVFDKTIITSKALELMLNSCERIDAICFDIKTGAEPKEEEPESYTDATEIMEHLAEFLDTLGGLEALDEEWYRNIKGARIALRDRLDLFEDFLQTECDGHLRRLLFYFLHRYLLSGAEDISVAARVRLAVYASLTILLLFYIEKSRSFDALCLAAKSFSKNVEYSTENTNSLIEMLL